MRDVYLDKKLDRHIIAILNTFLLWKNKEDTIFVNFTTIFVDSFDIKATREFFTNEIRNPEFTVTNLLFY